MQTLLSIGELKSIKGIPYSRSQIYRKIQAGTFVEPVRLGENRIAFVAAEVDAWIEARTAERDKAETT
jgi:prophage regulatory protein